MTKKKPSKVLRLSLIIEANGSAEVALLHAHAQAHMRRGAVSACSVLTVAHHSKLAKLFNGCSNLFRLSRTLRSKGINTKIGAASTKRTDSSCELDIIEK